MTTLNTGTSSVNELNTAKAFSRQSLVFDELYSADKIIQYKRERVRNHVLRYIEPGGRILELNAGTGEDAVYFAEKGYPVHATDISTGMLAVLQQKAAGRHLSGSITNELCSFTELETLADKGPYKHIFSNFAGLNCTDRLDKVLASFPALLEKNGVVTLVLLPRFCLWESALILKGKWKTAFRRFAGKKGAPAHLEGNHFTCWYYHPSYITEKLGDDFQLLSIEGLCTLVPPSYINGFAEKYPGLFRFLCRAEDRWKSFWPWRSIGDYYIISLRKR